MSETNGQNIHLFFTGAEAKISRVPFLLDAEMRPLTAANAWLRSVSHDGATSSFHTRRTYAYNLFDFFSYLQSRSIDWRLMSNDTIVHYRDIQDQNSSPHTKRPLSRRTINARLLSVSKFYEYSYKSGFLENNPLEYKKIKMRRPTDNDLLSHISREHYVEAPIVIYERLPKPSIKWYPHAIVMEWLNSINVWPDKLLAKILYRTGMRREEICNLKISDLPARSSIDPSTSEVSIEIIGKGRKKRKIHLATRDFIELHDYIKTERASRIRQMKAKHDFIFVARSGEPIKPASINYIFNRISERCGTKVTPHVLRHSFAVFALQHWRSIGVSQPAKLLQARLGHERITTTEIYMHLTDEMMAEEARANASLIDLLLMGEANEGK